MRTLFIGIFDNREPNTAMRNAIKKYAVGGYKEIGWTTVRKNSNLQLEVKQAVKAFKPQFIFMQLQAPNVLNSDTVSFLKRHGAYVVQWTGDVRQPMPKHYIDVGKKIDLSLFTNYNDVEEMRLHGCKADYLQCGADNTIYTPIGVRTLAPEIVFMGNHYDKQFELSDYRLRMVKFLKKTYGERFCVYGSGWAKELHAQNLMFWQTKEAEIYRSCKIAINCSHINLRKYTSDRFFRILLSGAFCLNKEFPEMEEYGNNFVSFSENFDELKNKIDYYLENETERNEIASRACEYAHNNWTWEHRIKELYELINYYKNVDK